MTSNQHDGRTLGALLLLQITGLIVPFVLLQPLLGAPNSYLARAAVNEIQLKVAVVLLLANSGLTVGLGVWFIKRFRSMASALTLWLVALAGVILALQAVDNAQILSMVSLSQRAAGATVDGAVQAVAAALGSTRRWTHVMTLFAIDAWIAILYLTIRRLRMVPGVLSAVGLAAVALHFMSIPLRMFLGQAPWSAAGVPMALAHVGLATLFIARGINTRTET